MGTNFALYPTVAAPSGLEVLRHRPGASDYIMDSMSDAALKLEIARLTGAINRHKSGTSTGNSSRPRNNVYVNPNYKPPAKTNPIPSANLSKSADEASTTTKDVIIGGVAFESSSRSLVRKDLQKTSPPSSSSMTVPPRLPPSNGTFTRVNGHLVAASRTYKPKSSLRRSRPVNRNMTLENSRRPYQTRRLNNKRSKYSDKPCPRFTTTGACSRGLTCFYQHDAGKIAICWNFLQGNCPNTADNCNLSHDPTPERTPLCMHFANNGRCTRENCPFPHVRVAARHGVCRDFAVLGYCAKGLDCDKQHVRECPDFAEKGSCTTKGCKLPHVIRANRKRKSAVLSSTTAQPPGATSSTAGTSTAVAAVADSVASGIADTTDHLQPLSGQDANLGDDFISLTFNESESSEDDSEEENDEEEDEDEDEDEDEESGNQ